MSRVDQTTRSNLKNTVEPTKDTGGSVPSCTKVIKRVAAKISDKKGKQYAHVNKTSLHSRQRFEVSWRKQY